MIGYKLFRADWCAVKGTREPFQYKVGETYTMEGEPHLARCGFHFCRNLADCFTYYGLSAEYRIAEVEALGDIDEDATKCCTNKIHIVREISWADVCKYL